MTRFRFSIASLLAVIAFIGISLAALRSPTQLWAGVALSGALSLLTISILAAIYRRGPRRAFWVGFSACGWMYLVLHLAPWFNSRVGPNLATTAALDFLFYRLLPNRAPAHSTPLFWYSASGDVKSLTSVQLDPPTAWLSPEWNDQAFLDLDRTLVVSTVRYRRIGHSLFAVLAAYLGGLLCRRLNGSTPNGRDHPV